MRGPVIREDGLELLHRATVEVDARGGLLFEGAAAVEPDISVDLTRSVQEWIWAECNAWALAHSTFPNEGEQVAQAIQRGDVRTSCDGSYMPQLDQEIAMATWILECPQMGEQCKGMVQVPGGAEVINAF